MYVEYRPHGPDYWAIFGPEIGQIYGFSSFSQELSYILQQSLFT